MGGSLYGRIELATCVAGCLHVLFPSDSGFTAMMTTLGMCIGMSNFKRWQLLPLVIALIVLSAFGPAFVVVSFPLSALSLLTAWFLPHPVLLKPSGPLAVGVADIEVEHPKGDDSRNVLTRVYYPAVSTTGSGESVPYFPSFKALCAFLDQGGPDVIKKYGPYVLYHFLLVNLNVLYDAEIKLPEQEKGYSVVIVSHGDGGNKECMSNICRDMASRGIVVIAIEHRDGSAQLTTRSDGKAFTYDKTGRQWGNTGDEYVWFRREQLETRTREVQTVMQVIREEHFPRFGEFLDPSKIVLLGHSFGGATMLTTQTRLNKPATCCIILDPAIDWMPDDARAAVLGKDYKDYGTPPNLSSGDININHSLTKGPARIVGNPIMFLYCSNWESDGWGAVRRIQKRIQGEELHESSRLHTLKDTGHVSFTDYVFMLPQKLVVAMRLGGERDPEAVTKDINRLTAKFIMDSGAGFDGDGGDVDVNTSEAIY